MKKYKEDIKTIIKVLLYILIYVFISYVKNPIAFTIFWGILILLVLYEIYSKIRYRIEKSTYILFPTMNDNYSKTTRIIIGGIISLLSFGTMVYWNTFNEYILIGIVLGLLVLTNGLLDLPNGRLNIKGNLIKISNLSSSIDQNDLKEIHISKEQLLLIPIDGEVKRIPNLDLDFKSAKLIQDYLLNHRTNPDLAIINRLNPSPDVTNL